MATTRHIVLVTYGEPPTPGFVEQLVYSWRILLGLTRTVAPIPMPLVPVIALARARGRRSAWTEARYQSPLEPITVGQARMLQEMLDAESSDRHVVHVAYEFRRPLVAETLAAIPVDEPVVIVPMYAADSSFTHALSRTAAAAFDGRAGTGGRVQVLPALDVATLAGVSVAHVLEQTGTGERWRGQDVALVLAAHGTLLNPSTPIDTGLAATEALSKAIARELRTHFGMVVNGWLNHTRGGRWTEPPIEEALARVVEAGYARAVYYPYGFLADNAESELEGRVALSRHAGLRSLHVRCFNESPALLAEVAKQVASGFRAAPPALSTTRPASRPSFTPAG